MNQIIKTCGHCYDGSGWFECDFYDYKDGKGYCKLFGNAEKDASESLIICNKIYGYHYEGRP